MKKNKKVSLIVLMIFLTLWQIIALWIDATYILPTPTQVIVSLWQFRVPLFRYHTPYTMLITVLGLFISIVLGLVLAISMDRNKKMEEVIYPIIVTTQTIPIIALAPLFILWFGYGILSKVVATVLITFFPITISMHDGFKNTKREHIELMKSFGASEWTIFKKLKVMSALPSFFSALKMAIPISIIGAVIGEWLGSQQGLGYFSRRMLTQLNGAGVFAPIVVLSFVAIILVNIVTVIEKRFLGKWRSEI